MNSMSVGGVPWPQAAANHYRTQLVLIQSNFVQSKVDFLLGSVVKIYEGDAQCSQVWPLYVVRMAIELKYCIDTYRYIYKQTSNLKLYFLKIMRERMQDPSTRTRLL